jgi:hypothetical protein
MSSRVKTFWILTTICIVAVVLYFGIPRLSSSSYIRNDIADIASESTASVTETVEQEESVMVEPIVPVRIATHTRNSSSRESNLYVELGSWNKIYS